MDAVIQDVVVLSSIAIFLPPDLVERYHSCRVNGLVGDARRR
jgi:hypothetical protein